MRPVFRRMADSSLHIKEAYAHSCEFLDVRSYGQPLSTRSYGQSLSTTSLSDQRSPLCVWRLSTVRDGALVMSTS